MHVSRVSIIALNSLIAILRLPSVDRGLKNVLNLAFVTDKALKNLPISKVSDYKWDDAFKILSDSN